MVSVNQTPITLPRFNKSIAAAIRHLTLLQGKYPEMQAYLVISSRGKQVGVGDTLKQMLTEHPNLLATGEAITQMKQLLEVSGRKKISAAVKRMYATRFQDLTEELEFDPTQQFELRFHHLDYALIQKLQSDPLTDQKLTPKSKASIRIVLGTVGSFANTDRCLSAASPPPPRLERRL